MMDFYWSYTLSYSSRPFLCALGKSYEQYLDNLASYPGHVCTRLNFDKSYEQY